MPAIHLDDVIGIELGKFVGAETAVGEDPDDQFVSLGGHRLLEEVELLAAEDVAGLAFATWYLRLCRDLLTDTFGPGEHQAHGSYVGADGAPGQRLPGGGAMVVEHDREGVEPTLIKLADLADPLLLALRQKNGIDGIAVLLETRGHQAPGTAVHQVLGGEFGKRGWVNPMNDANSHWKASHESGC